MRLINWEVQEAIAAASAGAALGAGAGGFATRAAAVEFLEIHVLERLQYFQEHAQLPADLRVLRAQATALHWYFEAANEWVLRGLRCRIRSGQYTAEELKRIFNRYAGPSGHRIGYDTLDLIVHGLLNPEPVPAERATRTSEMADYQATPARAVLALIERANLGPEDVFYDLGSGLGQVVILVALLSRARAKGIEFEPAYCEYARHSARRLHVPHVEFIQGNVREASFSDGTVFFMYTPFRGFLYQQVMERLQAEAQKRPIRVCTYGPCTAEMAGLRWLKPKHGHVFNDHEAAVFYSQPQAGRHWSVVRGRTHCGHS